MNLDDRQDFEVGPLTAEEVVQLRNDLLNIRPLSVAAGHKIGLVGAEIKKALRELLPTTLTTKDVYPEPSQ